MFAANKSIVALFLIGSFGSSANASFQAKRPAGVERSRIALANRELSPRQLSSVSGSSSYSSQTQVSSFMSSWQRLSQSFSQCQSAFSQRSSITVATQSVQQLYAQYQATVSQYESCSACASYLSQSGYTSQIQQSVTQMFSSFQSIISTGNQYYGEQFRNQFASTFQSMSSFGSFSQEVCSSAGVDLPGVLNSIGVNADIFSQLGINIGGNDGGLFGGAGRILGGIGLLGGAGAAHDGSDAGGILGGIGLLSGAGAAHDGSSGGGHGLVGSLL